MAIKIYLYPKISFMIFFFKFSINLYTSYIYLDILSAKKN
ncbi:unnamed protein product [Spirodela intermedia]|uniref:Uncharacterized protein n=1 Tax=Spirodela intermedia TaxID=51605 RepID=A0A7I8J586_SPIIN|nr:unnamed protein product [Spirodela intermedia]CAA6665261.1 unnamed protein product [Spirodela intermedia]